VSAQPAMTSVASPAVAAPLSERAAVAILGSMLLLIVALTVLLVQTTWAAASTSEAGTEILAPADYPISSGTKDLARH
jgi:hypothetical protein